MLSPIRARELCGIALKTFADYSDTKPELTEGLLPGKSVTAKPLKVRQTT
jgi:hypothetical protein